LSKGLLEVRQFLFALAAILFRLLFGRRGLLLSLLGLGHSLGARLLGLSRWAAAARALCAAWFACCAAVWLRCSTWARRELICSVCSLRLLIWLSIRLS